MIKRHRRYGWSVGVAATVAVLMIAASPVSAQTVDELVAKNIQAKGGLEKLHAVQTVKQTSTLTMQGMTASIIVYGKRPNLLRQEIKLGDQTIVNAFDGTTPWMINPLAGTDRPVVITGPQADMIRDQSSFDGPLVDYKDKGSTVELVGHETIDGRAYDHLKITDKDVETYYLKKSGGTSDLVELKLRQILIAVSATAAPEVIEAKRRLAQEVHQKLTDGMEFQDAVKIYSDDQNARETGGQMQPVRAKDLAPNIRTEVESLEVGQFTTPVRTALGFHVFYLEEKAFSGSQEFAAQKRQLEFDLRNQELMNQTRRWLTEQRQKSKVEIVAE